MWPFVSKCLLTQSCKCDSKNCTCCKDCYHCLSTLFLECCSCVELCPKPNETHIYSPKEFVVEDFEGLPNLFNALTSDSQDMDWSTFKFPIDFDAVLGGAKLENKFYLSKLCSFLLSFFRVARYLVSFL
uniref:Tsg N-terminal domain-containing protein n=1 Tax=Megaselia scalaris TaxID=36166 RepID=T1GPK6_MEGSC